MDTAQLIKLVAHRVLQLYRVEEKYSVVVYSDGCGSIAYRYESAVPERREAVEWRGEGGDRRSDIAYLQFGGRHAYIEID
jgi:hypothetical protein